MSDRFDLEQEIMNCWNVVEDIDFYIKNSDNWDEDERLNYLIGIKVKYDKKFDHMFNTFEECIAKKEFKPYEPTGGGVKFAGQSSDEYKQYSGKNLDDAYDELNDGYCAR
jgi:hypothetical protein